MFRCVLASVAAVLLLSGSATAQEAPPAGRDGPSTLEVLNQIVPELTIEEQPFKSVMDYLADLTKANLIIRWQVLEDAGLDPEQPITLRIKHQRLAQVLWLVLTEAGGSDLKLAYRAVGNRIEISTHEALNQEMFSRVYDLRDLLVGIARFAAPQMDPGQALSQQGSGGGGSGGNSLFRGNNQQRNNQAVSAEQTPELASIVNMIKKTIEPDSWEEGGESGRGQIHPFGGMIVVYNTAFVHQQIAGFVEEEELGR